MYKIIFFQMWIVFLPSSKVRLTRPIGYKGLLTFLKGWFPNAYAYMWDKWCNKATWSYDFKSFSLSSVSQFFNFLYQELLDFRGLICELKFARVCFREGGQCPYPLRKIHDFPILQKFLRVINYSLGLCH